MGIEGVGSSDLGVMKYQSILIISNALAFPWYQNREVIDCLSFESEKIWYCYVIAGNESENYLSCNNVNGWCCALWRYWDLVISLLVFHRVLVKTLLWCKTDHLVNNLSYRSESAWSKRQVIHNLFWVISSITYRLQQLSWSPSDRLRWVYYLDGDCGYSAC